MFSKAELRVRFRQRRETLAADLCQGLSHQIQEKAIAFLKSSSFSFKTIGLYASFRNEVETSLLFEAFRKEGNPIFYPRVSSEKKSLRFYQVDNFGQMKAGTYGLLEPLDSLPEAKSLDLLVVPGVVFDLEGYRLGYGGGFYDRLVSFPTGIRLGLAYDFQVIEALPHEKNDVVCDLVVTEKRIISPSNKAQRA
ncbi:MAG: 5-formyltetrahydrofolate cyclo-ligase [Deltaproteobacteria bacterium]|nr:5-formyltetrahydrofolate cyclo-ligase [Deltaproteobacteria bacterium]